MFLTRLLHIPQIALSAYGLYLSTIAITQLRQYEATSEKAAEYSGEAERQLHKTRTTQASGAVCILTSLIASTTLAMTPSSLPSLAQYTISPAVLVLTLFVQSHVSNFWKAKPKVPFVGGYNDAIQKTGQLLQILQYLEYSWALSALVGGLMGY